MAASPLVTIVVNTVKTIESKLPAGTVELIEEELTEDALAHVDLDALVGSMSPTVYAAFATAMANHASKLQASA